MAIYDLTNFFINFYNASLFLSAVYVNGALQITIIIIIIINIINKFNNECLI